MLQYLLCCKLSYLTQKFIDNLFISLFVICILYLGLWIQIEFSRKLSKIWISYDAHNKFPIFFHESFSVPPNIDDSSTSSDVIVREGSNVTLKCHAVGSPKPSIKWKRDDGGRISITKSLEGKDTFNMN